MATTPQTEPLSRLDVDMAGVRQTLSTIGQDANPLLATVAEHIFSTSGKLFRPRLTLLASHLVLAHGGQLADYALLHRLAATSELIHAASLVHDDTLDDAETRRGAITVNARWGMHTAVLLGDYLFAQAAMWTASLGSLRLMDLLAQTIGLLVQGEIVQMQSGRTLSEDSYYSRIHGKTASLFLFCAEGAAELCGASSARVEALRTYGQNIGLAFQIVDDVLDFTATARDMGKPVGGDLAAGIVTLPAMYYLASLPADSAERQRLAAGDNLGDLAPAIAASPAIEAALFQARRLAREGVRALSLFPASPERAALEALADDVVARRS